MNALVLIRDHMGMRTRGELTLSLKSWLLPRPCSQLRAEPGPLERNHEAEGTWLRLRGPLPARGPGGRRLLPALPSLAFLLG